MKKIASILDYSYPYLDPAIWDHEMKLYSYHKDFIYRLLNRMYENYQLKQPEVWITDIHIIGSLTTSKWLFTSDLDVHLQVNLAKFIETNMPGTDPQVAFDYLDNTRKEFDRAKILAPMTQHPIEYYFEVPEFISTNTDYVGVYSLTQDKWLKDPVLFAADVDFEESKKQVMDEAEAIAGALDGSFGKIDRQIDRINELERMIHSWGPDKQQLFYTKIEEKLKTIEAEILKDLELRQQLVDERHEAQDPMAPIEIKFKWLARFGFFGILSNLKTLLKETGGQITLTELPLVQKIVTNSSLKEAFLKEALDKHERVIFVDFDDTISHENDDHSMGEPLPGAKETIKKLREKGYEIIIDSVRANEEKGRKEIEDYLKKNEIDVDGIYEGDKPLAFRYIDDRAIEFNGTWDGILEKIEKAHKHASLRVAKLNQKYWIDPSGKEYPVDHYEGHYGWVLKNILKGNMEDYPSGPPPEVEDKANDMIQEGWTRVTTESDYDFAMEVADLRRVPSYLDNFIAQHYTGGGVEIDDLNGEYQDLEDPFPWLQKQINIARQRRLQPAARAFSKLDIKAQTKKVKQGDYSCVMALVPHDLAQEIVEWGVRNVPDEELYLSDGGKLGRELESHITIKYGLLTNNAKDVRRSFNEDKPYKAKLGKVRHFQPPELPFDVLTIEVISEDLNKANERTCKMFDCADDLPSNEYKPHITIAYMKRDTAKEYIGSDEFEGKDIELDTLIFSPHKGNRTYFSVAHDKESRFILEKINKFASWDAPGYWIDPKGVIYDTHGEGLIHNEWVLANLKMLRDNYGIKIPNGMFEAWDEYVNALEEGDEDNIDMPADDSIWHQMFQQGWIRVGDADEGVGVELNNLRAIPNFLDSILVEDLHDGMIVTVEDINHNTVHVEYPFKSLQQAVNQALSGQSKTASGDNFLPSLFNAPNNDWQFQHGGDDQEIGVDPDPISDETTWYAPCTEGKPRTKEVWRQFMSMFKNPFSKKESVELESYDKDLEEKEKKELGEDQTLLEFQKDLPDPTKHDFPHNTTWDPIYQDGEPSKPGMPVTYSPQISNEDNLDQNSPDGFPRRFMGKPKGEWTSNQGEINNAIIEMLRRRNAALDILTEDITKKAFLQHAYWIDPNGKVWEVRGEGEFDDSDYSHWQWVQDNEDMLEQEYGITDLDSNDYVSSLVNHGWTRIGDSISAEQWQVQVPDLHAIPKAVDNVLAQFVPDGADIDFADSNNLFITLTWPWNNTQGAINRALRRSLPMAASLKQAADLSHAYWLDPSGKMYQVRGAEFGKTYTGRDTHDGWIKENLLLLKEEYGLKPRVDQWGSHLDSRDLIDNGWIRIGDSYGNDWSVTLKDLNNIPTSVDSCLAQFAHDGAQIEVYAEDNGAYETIEWPVKSVQQAVNKARTVHASSLNKNAGEQSASVPDYLMDEWKTDQINDDTDEAPYINHDQRDYPYGMQDAPQDTTDFNWPYMNQPYVVRLDILENPAYRLDPFGIGEYNVTWYESLPAGDGIEKN